MLWLENRTTSHPCGGKLQWRRLQTAVEPHFLRYPLVNVNITMGNHNFSWVNQLSMAIFNSYVSLPLVDDVDGRSGRSLYMNMHTMQRLHVQISSPCTLRNH